jgi:hypothetical protein
MSPNTLRDLQRLDSRDPDKANLVRLWYPYLSTCYVALATQTRRNCRRFAGDMQRSPPGSASRVSISIASRYGSRRVRSAQPLSIFWK